MLEDIYPDKIPTFEILDEEWATALQNGLEEYMGRLYDAVMMESEATELDEDAADNTESGISFCGCNVCEGREILAYVTPRIIKGYLERKVNIVYM